VLAGVEYSIYFTAPSAGLNGVNLLKAPTTLVGVAFNYQYLGVVIDAVRTAFVPNAAANGGLSPIIPVHWSFSGLSINIVFQTAGQVGILFFGNVLRGSISLDAYSGVLGKVTGSNSGTTVTNVSASSVLEFPTGVLKLVGLAYLFGDTSSAYDVWSFSTAGGLSITGVGYQNSPLGGAFVITPLDDVFTAQSLTVEVTMYNVAAGGTHTAYIIAYYRF